jgi:hypothetical protein
MTGSVERKSTTDMVAPAAQAGRYRDVKDFPSQRRTPKRTGRPQASPQLQHSDGESKIHRDCFHTQAAGITAVNLDKYFFLPIGSRSE